MVSWLLNDSAGEGTVEGNRTSSANADGSEETLIRLSIRASLKRTGKEMKFIVEGVTNSAPADTTLIRLLVRGQKIAKRMFESKPGALTVEMVLVRDIPLYGSCEHHLIPFAGRAHVAYIPGSDGRITGLSKIARLVEGFARRPQVQERLTTQIADALAEALQPAGVLVMIEAEHLCMSMRGVKKPGALTVTSAVRGLFKTNPATRAEAMSLITAQANRL